MTKSELRNIYKTKRLGLTEQEVVAKSRLINSRAVSAMDWSKIKSAHCYCAISNEVSTQAIHEWMRRRGIFITNPSKEITLEEMTYKYDLIIVPLLAFDSSLHRVGYGGGFYDRLLAVQHQGLNVGFAYDFSLVASNIPIEPHDQPLDFIFTETTTIKREPPSK